MTEDAHITQADWDHLQQRREHLERTSDWKEKNPGPWTDEPDDDEWEAFGYLCRIHRSDVTGSLCGYVAVPEGHPWFGSRGVFDEKVAAIDCHGGVTWAREYPPNPLVEWITGRELIWPYWQLHQYLPGAVDIVIDVLEERGLSRRAAYLRGEPMWWLGFDCGHAFDAMPRLEYLVGTLPGHVGRSQAVKDMLRETYRPWEYVVGQVNGMAKQAQAAMEDHNGG